MDFQFAPKLLTDKLHDGHINAAGSTILAASRAGHCIGQRADDQLLLFGFGAA